MYPVPEYAHALLRGWAGRCLLPEEWACDGGGPAMEPERTLSRFRQVSGVLGVVSRGLLACAPVRMQPACDLD
jgi:hypothetical protein